MTRPGNDPARSPGSRSRQPGQRESGQRESGQRKSGKRESGRRESGRSTAPERRPPAVGRSSLWADRDDDQDGPQPLRASWDPVDTRPGTTSRPRPVRTGRRRSAVGWFFHRYGWRAYAIPALVALSVLVVLQVGRRPAPGVSATSGAVSAITTVISGVTTTMTVTASPTARTPGTAAAAGAGTPATPSGSAGPVPDQAFTGLSSATLPPGGAFATRGKGTWHVVPGSSAPMGSGPNRYTFSVEVEDGIENVQADQDFASLVDSTLADPRSWIGSGTYTLQRVATGTPSFRISLTSQLTVRDGALCGWEIHYEASCYARNVKRVTINDARWTRGAVSFNGDRGSYRAYAINHEVGHALGYLHQPCAADGGLAPVMMQQSWSTANNDLAPLNPQLIPMDGKVCRFNPYPYPLGAAPAAKGHAATAPPAPTKAGG